MTSGPESNNPYAFTSPNPSSDHPPEPLSSTPPAVRFWAQFYNICMLMLYFILTLVGILLVAFADEIGNFEDGQEIGASLMGTLYAGLGLLFVVIFAIGLFWRRGNGAWIYQIVLIAIGLTSCITWPATIPLMIYWIKDRDRLIRG